MTESCAPSPSWYLSTVMITNPYWGNKCVIALKQNPTPEFFLFLPLSFTLYLSHSAGFMVFFENFHLKPLLFEKVFFVLSLCLRWRSVRESAKAWLGDGSVARQGEEIKVTLSEGLGSRTENATSEALAVSPSLWSAPLNSVALFKSYMKETHWGGPARKN